MVFTDVSPKKIKFSSIKAIYWEKYLLLLNLVSASGRPYGGQWIKA